MQPETMQLEMPLRRAPRRAGLVSGYRHTCRKEGCGYVGAATDAGIRTCPRHDHKLWVTAVVRPIRFHDLRHTTGSLLTMRGANTRFVQRIMRHSDPRMTERYSHFDPDYLHSKLDELMRFQPSKPTPDPEPVAAAVAAPAADPAALSTQFLPDAAEGGSEPHAGPAGPSGFRYLRWCGFSGLFWCYSAWEADTLPTELIPRECVLCRDFLGMSTA